MKQLINDIFGFLKNVNQVDLLLYFAVLVLIILVVSLLYIIKNEDNDYVEEKEGHEELDLKEVVSEIKTAAPIADFTTYEKDQEETAIISYDELVAKNKTGNIHYNEEKILDDEISIKKINLDEMGKEKIEEKNCTTQVLLKYANEEAFLKALQALNEVLN